MRFQQWGKIESICPQNDIAGIYFIMDRAELRFSFYSMSGMAQIFADFPTGSKQKRQKWQKTDHHCKF